MQKPKFISFTLNLVRITLPSLRFILFIYNYSLKDNKLFFVYFCQLFYFVIFIFLFECDFMKVCHFFLVHEYEGAPVDGAHKLSHHLQNLEGHEKCKCFLLTLTFVFIWKNSLDSNVRPCKVWVLKFCVILNSFKFCAISSFFKFYVLSSSICFQAFVLGIWRL